MKVKFLGAARTVTGSCFILEVNGARFAVDCGMYQGNREIEKRNWSIEPYEPQNLDFILVTRLSPRSKEYPVCRPESK